MKMQEDTVGIDPVLHTGCIPGPEVDHTAGYAEPECVDSIRDTDPAG